MPQTQNHSHFAGARPRVSRLFELASRRLQPEVMDDPALDTARHHGALLGLSRLNWIGNNAGLLWRPLAKLSRKLHRPMRVLDIATGGGDVLISLAKRAARRRLPVDFAGCDISARAIDYASAAAKQSRVAIEFFQHDALHDELPSDYDAVICSLFLHHLQREDACDLLRRIGRASQHVVLASDLNRTRATMVMTYAASRLLTRSDVVHVDGPLSVQAAFTVDEARQLAHDAGLAGATVKPAFPCRYLLTWWKPEVPCP